MIFKWLGLHMWSMGDSNPRLTKKALYDLFTCLVSFND